MKLLMCVFKISHINEVHVYVKHDSVSIMINVVRACLELIFMNNDDYVKGILTCIQTHYE